MFLCGNKVRLGKGFCNYKEFKWYRDSFCSFNWKFVMWGINGNWGSCGILKVDWVI